MFGLMRYGFALCVLGSHVYSKTPPGPAAYAVWGFFCLSGYLMALVLAEKYPFSRSGLAAFATSRALRLLPAYYAACLLAVVVLATFPAVGEAFIGLRLPRRAVTWFNAAIPLLPPMGLGDVIAQFGAVRVEILYYALMALGLARSKRVAWAWWVAGAAYAAWQVATGASFNDRYTTPAGTSVAFATGVLIYHHRGDLPTWRSPWAIAAAGVAWAGHFAIVRAVAPGEVLGLGLYSSLAASALAIILLRGLSPKSAPGWLARLDGVLGDLSYPVYLTHWSAAVLVSAALHKGKPSFTQAVLTFLACNAISWAIFRYVETPGDRLRKRLTRRNLEGTRNPPSPHSTIDDGPRPEPQGVPLAPFPG